MPCHLCAERSEDYPKPAIFRTPFMATAFPDFKAETDFLCPKCYTVYFRIIECKYGPRQPRLFRAPRPPNAEGPATSSNAAASMSVRWRLNQPAYSPPGDAEPEEMNASKRMRENK